MEGKRILLLAPSFMDIYKDVIECLEHKGWMVSWIKDKQVSGNPYIKDNHFWDRKPLRKYNREVESLWARLLTEPQYCYSYDAFLAIDGTMVHPYLFDTLVRRNPKVKKILFLYDSIDGHYQLDSFFTYYDSVFSFNRKDCAKFHLNFLPIYWLPSNISEKSKYGIFGFGSLRYKCQDRIIVFEKVKNFARANNISEYIKLLSPINQNKYLYAVKYMFLKLSGKKCFSMKELKNNDLFASHSISAAEFRNIIQQSTIILDTQNDYQDGLTARFMWALGLEKKIITTNDSARLYDFYDENQIFVLKDNYDELLEFVEAPFRMTETNRANILKYRIDNWIDTLLAD